MKSIKTYKSIKKQIKGFAKESITADIFNLALEEIIS